MKAAIYCRVSTDNQEQEGTSLQTQLEACLQYCQDKDYEVAYQFSEAYSGLSLERPELDKLRELVRSETIGVVVVYELGRLTRDPGHGVIITLELEKHGVKLEAVTESVDTSDLGRLITYIKGYAAKLEAEKIRERTMRGKKARALSGKLPANSHARLYGYTYVCGKETGQGIRCVKEDEAQWVRKIYQWLVEEGLSLNAITYQLRDLNIPTPSGKGFWIKSTVHKILTNPAYKGKTYAFTQTYGLPTYRLKADTKRKKTGLIRKPKEEWLEIPNATPAIVSEDLWEDAQQRLKRNSELASRNTKREYLLNGHIRCAKCGRAYWGKFSSHNRGIKHYERRYYRCSGNIRSVTPEPCGCPNVNANEVERLVWKEVEAVLTTPKAALFSLETKKAELDKTPIWQRELETIESQIANKEKQRDRIHRAFYLTGDEDKFKHDIGALDNEIKSLKHTWAELQKRITDAEQYNIDADRVMQACELIRQNLGEVTFQQKRFALEALQVKIRISEDGTLQLTGCIPLNVAVASTPSIWHGHNTTNSFPFCIPLAGGKR